MKKQQNSKFYFNNKFFECPKEVYFPSEDSYFLAENISVKKNSFCMDIGCGSGIQTLNMLFKGASKVTAIDLNEEALEITAKNCEKAGFGKKVSVLKSNLFKKYSNRKADLIVFNPPYLVSDGVKYIDLDGGRKGRETLDVFLEQFPQHLEKFGKCFFIQTDLNGYKETNEILKKQKIKFEITAKRKGFFEELAVYSCTKT